MEAKPVKITTFLSFNDKAEEAMNFYATVFKQAKIGNILRNEPGGYGPAGSMLVGDMELYGQQFMFMNGGSSFSFTQGISLWINPANQEEIDEIWDKLTDEGEPIQCGWLKDKFGVSWQVAPDILGEMLSDKDKKKQSG